ncbi:MAG: hypothetical protein GY950_10390 [bacterium]|nr:hypothetical protein [bacterium]
MEKKIRVSIEKKALEVLQKRGKEKNLLIGNVLVDNIPSTGKNIYKVDAFKADEPNGPRYDIVLDENGKEVDLAKMSKADEKPFFERPQLTLEPGPITGKAASITINPNENILVLEQGDVFDELITVTVPADTGVDKVDVYFLADTTYSMVNILASVRTGANNILNSLAASGLDIAFGVGNYKDFPKDPYAFQHQQNPTTTVASAAAAINSWSHSGGWDTPEGQLYALDQLAQAPGGSIGWRTGAKRIIVWFGDAPGHDPVCSAISGLSYDITEASVTGKLTTQSISVIAISTDSGTPDALDGNPTGGNDYTSACGSPGGTAGQATRIAAATGGIHVTGISEATIVNTIITLVSSAATTINNINLAAVGGTAPFVVSISPAGGYGPLSGDTDHNLDFKVRFEGVVPCTAVDQVFTGYINVIADGVVVARKRVRITVPACEPKELYSYSVKFVCGKQEGNELHCTPGVLPGVYATDINIHNYHKERVLIKKYVLPLVMAGVPQGREPKYVGIKAQDSIVLPGNSATMDDCCRIAQLLFGPATPPVLPLTIGFLEIVSPVELSVTAVYTASGLEKGHNSIDVEQIVGKLKFKKEEDHK